MEDNEIMIQVFGSNKSFDCKAAQRFFKERRIPFQFVDLKEKEMSGGEFDSVLQVLVKEYGSRNQALEAMIDKNSRNYSEIAYLDDDQKEEKLFENQLKLLKLPICRNGKNAASCGINEKLWQNWS